MAEDAAVKSKLELEKPSAPAPAATGAEVHAAQVGESKGKRIGDTLVEQGIITLDQLQVALHEKQKSGRMLGEILVDLGFISTEILTSFLAESTGFQEFDPKKTMLDPEALELILDGLQPEPHWTHLSIGESIALVDELRIGKTWLTHFSCRVDYEKLGPGFPPNVELAWDGLRLMC